LFFGPVQTIVFGGSIASFDLATRLHVHETVDELKK
jgi:hypothetical protein